MNYHEYTELLCNRLYTMQLGYHGFYQLVVEVIFDHILQAAGSTVLYHTVIVQQAVVIILSNLLTSLLRDCRTIDLSSDKLSLIRARRFLSKSGFLAYTCNINMNFNSKRHFSIILTRATR